MKTLGTIKRGDTLAFYMTMTDDSGNAITGIAAKLSSQLRS